MAGRSPPVAPDYLTLCRIAAMLTAICAGASVGLGILSGLTTGNPMMLVIPALVGVALAICLALAWHVLLGFAAHAHSPGEVSLCAAIGVGLMLFGIGTSAWYLASLIGGPSALQAWEIAYTDKLTTAAEAIERNAADEGALIASVRSAAFNLDGLATSEGEHGTVSGKVGKNVVYATIKNASNSMSDKAAGLAKIDDERRGALTRARASIADAMHDASARDHERFEEDAARAYADLTKAAAVHLTVGDIGIGTMPNLARIPIETARADLTGVAAEVAGRQRKVDLPVYQPVDAKGAIAAMPNPLAWLAAVVLEALPLVFLCLLLSIRKETLGQAGEVGGQDRPVKSRPYLVG